MTFITILHTFDKQKYADLLEYCKRASERDPTFKYSVQADRIIIESQSHTQAMKRGVLFHARFGCFFEVLKQNQQK